LLKNVQDLTSAGKQAGLNTQTNIIAIDNSQSPDMMDVKVEYDGTLTKRLGSNTQNSVVIANSAAFGFSPVGNLTQNLIAYWKLDDVSGNRKDSYGGHTLTDVNGVPSDGGIRNKSASFVAANTGYLLHSNTSTLATGDVDFSISTWFYLSSTSTTTQRAIISKKDTNASQNTQLLLHCNGSDGSTTITDSSLNSNPVTANSGARLSTSINKFSPASLYLPENSGSFISALSSSIFNVGANDMTLDFWVYFETLPGAGANSAAFGGVKQDANNVWAFRYDGNGFVVEAVSNSTTIISAGITHGAITTSAWHHIALVKTGTAYAFFIDGIQSGATVTDANDLPPFNNNFVIGPPLVQSDDARFDGYIDEYRFSNVARYSANFTPETAAYANPSNPNEFEYWLYVNTDNILTFEVSSSGTTQNGQVRATSFGALTTSTWYNAIAYHDTGNLIAVGINLSMNSGSYSSGVRSGSAPFVIGCVSNGIANFFDGRVDETSFYKRVLNTTDRSNIYNAGSANTFADPFNPYPWASFDFGASSIRWLMVSAGTGVYASSNLGISWVNVATDRTANYQKFERSKNVLVATSDSYDIPLAWPGSSGTYMVSLNSNAPLCKYAINFQGFLILLNSSTRKRGFFYQDENTQLTGTWASSFDIPSSQDDEITSAFILRRYLYVSTRYYLYRVSYVGGNPDFSYLKVKDWGYVQRTVKQLYVEGVGEVVAGLCWDGKMRFFDGSDDQIFSNDIEQDNSMCDFALKKISYAGSGPVASFSEVNPNENTYKLVVAIGEDSSQTTHMLNYDGRAKAFYPYSNQFYNTMTMAESANRKYLMAFDRSGFCHMLDSGNLDGNTTAINEHFDSAILFEKSPSQSHKGFRTDLFFSNKTCGTLHVLDRTDFSTDYKKLITFEIDGTEKKTYIHIPIDTPESYNAYQWRLTSSSGTSNPWAMQRSDHFLKGQGIGQQ